MATNIMNENNLMSNNNKRKLSELRVIELRNELQKRNEDISGVKALLVSRLSAALEKEGHNPEEYIFTLESTKKNVARRTGTPIGKMITKEETDSDSSDVQNDGQEMSDSLNENDISIDESANESTTEKTGYEASDIIEDALQLAVDDELKEEREDITVISENKNSSKAHNEVISKKFTEDEAVEDMGVMLSSPPKPETAPVVAPLTIEDKINMDTSKQRKAATDDVSLIVNLDDTQSDVLDADLDVSDISTLASAEIERNSTENSTEIKPSNRKTNNELNNSTEPKSEGNGSTNNSTNIEDTNNANSTKELNRDSENKDSSAKSKSSNVAKDNKVKNKDSKNVTSGQKVSQNTSNGRNIWVSGLSQSTKASELQLIFSKHGKVVSAKIIKNARMSGSRCYGFITMENSEQVTKCISQLNKTDLHGRAISLSRNRPQETPSKAAVSRSKPIQTKRDNAIKKPSTKSSDTKKESVKESDNKETIKETKSDEKSDESIKTKNSDEKDSSENSSKERTENKDKRKPIRAPLRDRGVPFRRPIIPFRRSVPIRRPFVQNSGPNFRSFRRPMFARGGIRTMMPIKRVDVDRNIRERERERQLREERRRREELFRVQRDIEREERIRFEREKERLKLERVKLEREKAEFFKYERERAKLEREKIEREREELRRRQQSQIPIQHRVEESRSRSAIVSSTINKRPFETREIRGNDPYWEDRKRIQQVQRMEAHILPSRQTYVDSSAAAGNRHITHGYEARNDSYKRSRIDMAITGNSRSEFDTRRHDSRHGSGHDRDERKSGSGPTGSYYRDSSRGASFASRDRRMSSQRDEWKTSHDSRRDRYADKPLTGGSNTGFGGTSRYAGGDSRGWSDRTANSLNKVSFGTGNVHMSGGQPWNSTSGDRWNSAIGSSGETRSRGQPSLNASMLSGANPSIAELFGSSAMTGMGLNISHSLSGGGGSNSLGAGDRPYLHSNRRF